MKGMHSATCEMLKNQIFNHNFVFPDTSGNFPSGWEKYIESPLAVIYWQKDYKHHYCIMISNPFHGKKASIFQQTPFYVPVNKQELWEVGARFRVYRKMRANITVHYVKNNIRVSQNQIDFHLMPGIRYYCRSISIPDDIDLVYLELGTEDSGQFWIENVVFAQLFPHSKSINVNTVEAVKRIIDPVKVEKLTRDTVEDVIAGPVIQASELQDVLTLSTYTFSVLNLGDTEANVQLQMSPDGINFMDEAMANHKLAPGQIRALDFNQFLRYAKVTYWTEDGNTTRLRIFFQAQG